MGSAGQRPLMAFAWHRLNRVPYRRLLLVGLLSCVCSFPVWADEPPDTEELVADSPSSSRRRSATDAEETVGAPRSGDRP